MAHKYEHVSTGAGFAVLNDGIKVVAINQDGTLNGSTVIDDGSITLVKLATAVSPSHVVKFANEVTWTGGLVTLAVTVTGALATDIVIANFQTIGTEGTVLAAVVTDNTVTFTLDTANTTNDAVVSYQVLRATS